MMIDAANFLLFFTASWILIISPGPDMLYVISRGISQGRRAGILSAIGVTLGILVHTLLAAFGLAALLQTSALAFLVVKYLGAAYLIYLGIKALKDKSRLALPTEQNRASYQTIFWQGTLSNVLNPKIALFFIAFLPQFVNPARGYWAVQMMLLGLTFALFGVIFLGLVGYFSGEIGSWLARQPGMESKLRWLSGLILIGLGLRLALGERR